MSQLKSKRIFTEADEKTQDAAQNQEQELTLQRQFQQKDEFLPQPVQEEGGSGLEQDLTKELTKPSGKRRSLLFGLAAFGGLALWQSVDQVYNAWLASDWLALGWAGLLSFVATMGVGALTKEWLKLRTLKKRISQQEQAATLVDMNGIGKGKPFCVSLAKQSGLSTEHPGYDRWLNSLAATHNDTEVLELYDQMVLSHQDKQAKALVGKYSSEAALMVAVSPLATVDMLLVAWRNLKLIEQLSKVYGVELGYWSRIRLLKLVLTNMALAGASEVVADVGMDLLSMDLAGRLSTRAAQGVGVGLLTARLGLKAIALVRPLPWMNNNKPKLSEVRKSLLSQLSSKTNLS